MTLPAPNIAKIMTQQSQAPIGLALFLDVDGTLLEIAERPHEVNVSEQLQVLLRNLGETLDGAMALISGRSIADLDRLFRDSTYSVAGSHGLERRTQNGERIDSENSMLDNDVVSGLLALGDIDPAILVENKGRTIAIHYRQAPSQKTNLQSRIRRLIADRPDLIAMSGKMVIEVKPASSDKGSAIDAFMSETPFEGRLPVFLGDDVTDEAGFAAVRKRGGISILVGEEKETTAEYRLSTVAATHQWLGEITRFLADKG